MKLGSSVIYFLFISKALLPDLSLQNFISSSKTFIVLAFTFNSVVDWEGIFIYDVECAE